MTTTTLSPQSKSRGWPAWCRVVVSHRRIPINDAVLATLLATVAGAVNAGGFFVVGQYTSHMTGYLSQAADHLVVGNFWTALKSLLAIVAFITGAAATSILVNWARAHHVSKQYALPIAVQGGVLSVLSLKDVMLGDSAIFPLLLAICVLMGMQNATITKISRARIRTTHVTGMVTDIGIEVGRWVYGLRWKNSNVSAEPRKFSILVRLVLAYLGGGIAGALGFAMFGFLAALPLALLLLAVSIPTLVRPKLRR